MKLDIDYITAAKHLAANFNSNYEPEAENSTGFDNELLFLAVLLETFSIHSSMK